MDPDEKLTFIERITQFASNVIGSWWMIGIQTVCIAVWFYLNLASSSPTGRFDNERFDTLRLVLSFQSVYTAPLILMAQRRTSAKDREMLKNIDDLERQGAELRSVANERRERVEGKVDALNARLDELISQLNTSQRRKRSKRSQ